MTDTYDPDQIIAAARTAAYATIGFAQLAGDEAATRQVADAVNAAVHAVLDRLEDLVGGAINCPDPEWQGQQPDLDRGHDEALDWVCRELETLKEATR